MALTLESGLKELPGIGDARAAKLAKLGLATVENLLGYYPRSYEDRTKISTIDGAPEEQPVCVVAFVVLVWSVKVMVAVPGATPYRIAPSLLLP